MTPHLQATHLVVLMQVHVISAFYVVFLRFHVHRRVFLQTRRLDMGPLMSIRTWPHLPHPHFVLSKHF